MMDAKKDPKDKDELKKSFEEGSHATRKADYNQFKKDKGGKEQVSLEPAPAILVVSLPAKARLTIDGTRTSSKSALRSFITPKLTPGVVYSYTLTATWTLNGRQVSTTRHVKIEAGRTIHVRLNGGMAVASR